MSHSQFCDWLIEIAGGWLGWSPDQYMYCHMQDILISYDGKLKMLKACYGTDDSKSKKKIAKKGKPITIQDFDNVLEARKR